MSKMKDKAIEEHNIQEENKLIAEFIGANFVDCGNGIHIAEVEKSFCPENMSSIDLGCLKYNKSWDWLMSVVKEIESYEEVDEFKIIYDSHFEGHITAIIPAYEHLQSVYVSNTDKITSVYDAVVKFINMYNKEGGNYDGKGKSI